MDTKKALAVVLCAALALTLAACGAKTESEPEPTATPEVTAAPEPTATPEPIATSEEAMAEETDTDVVTPVSKSVDLSNATVHSGSEFGAASDTNVYDVDGRYYLEDGHELKYSTKYNEWQVDLTEDFAGKKFDMTAEEVAEENKKAEEDTQRAKEYLESGQALKDLEAYYAKHPDQPH